MSEPCCMSDPMVNQKLFDKVNLLSCDILASRMGLLNNFPEFWSSHSYGENLATIYSVTDTTTYANSQ
jgi:hypothetical protein